MTLLELINKEINNTPNTKALKSLTTTAFIEARTTLNKVLDEHIINAWIKDGLLDYSRRGKNRLKDLLNILDVGEIDKVVLIHRYEERKGKLTLERKNLNHNISWKSEVIRVTVADGAQLKGVLKWWEKDYSLCMIEPFEANCGGSHLMYSIPIVYVLTETSREGVKQINILEKAKGLLLQRYENRYINQDIKLTSFRLRRPYKLSNEVRSAFLFLLLKDLEHILNEPDDEE